MSTVAEQETRWNVAVSGVTASQKSTLDTLPIRTLTLRPDQQAPVNETRQRIISGEHPVVLTAPCGWGKSYVACYIINGAVARSKHVLFLVNRRILVNDLSKRLSAHAVEHGVIMADDSRRRPWCPVQVASIDTLQRRVTLPKADLIIVDECHFSLSPNYLKLLARYPGVPVIGLTATPIRLNGRGLGSFYKSIVQGPPDSELTAAGLLVRPRVFAPSRPDLSSVRIQDGDYNQRELAVVMDRSRLIGDIVDTWRRNAAGRPSVVFAVTVEHSRHIVEQAVAAGIRAVHVDANTPDRERDAAWDGLESGRLDWVSNVGIASYGWDSPATSCCILARPTMSLGLYLQMVGRVRRPFPGKQDCIVLDHAGNVLRHGFPDEDRVWLLEDQPKRKRSSAEPATGIWICAKCWGANRVGQMTCSVPDIATGTPCGEPKPKQAREVEHAAGELAELKRGRPLRCDQCGIQRNEGEPDVGGESAMLTSRHRCSPNAPDGGPAGTWVESNWSQPPNTSTNPEVAELQRIAFKRNYKPGWVHVELTRRRNNRHREAAQPVGARKSNIERGVLDCLRSKGEASLWDIARWIKAKPVDVEAALRQLEAAGSAAAVSSTNWRITEAGLARTGAGVNHA